MTLTKVHLNHLSALQDPSATTPSKGSKKDKKDKKSKRGEKAVNGEDVDHDRASPEINTQEQMAAQRASGGEIEAPPPEVFVSWTPLLFL